MCWYEWVNINEEDCISTLLRAGCAGINGFISSMNCAHFFLFIGCWIGLNGLISKRKSLVFVCVIFCVCVCVLVHQSSPWFKINEASQVNASCRKKGGVCIKYLAFNRPRTCIIPCNNMQIAAPVLIQALCIELFL